MPPYPYAHKTWHTYADRNSEKTCDRYSKFDFQEMIG